MKEVILLLYEQGVKFTFEGDCVVLGLICSSCCNTYGYTKTEILYNCCGDGKYTVMYGFRGFPYIESFCEPKDVVESAVRLARQHSDLDEKSEE